MSDSEEIDECEEEDYFIKYNVPDEIIEKIIGYLPWKKNCFLVSKTFYRESIKATREKYFLNMDQDNIMSPGFMNIQRKFNDIRWHGDHKPVVALFTRGREFFEKFGTQIKEITISDIRINLSVLLEVLALLPNLVNLSMVDCLISNDQPAETLELSKLYSLAFWRMETLNGLLDHMVCPSLRSIFHEAKAPLELKSLHRFKQLEYFMLSGSLDDGIDNLSFKYLCRLKLKILSLVSRTEDPRIAVIIESQPQLTTLSFAVSAGIQIETLRQIVKLPLLRKLQIKISTDASVPPQLIRQILQMPKLVILEMCASDDEVIKAMFSVENPKLESLTIRTRSVCLRQGLKRVPSLFPNLRSLHLLRFVGDLKCFTQLKKLELIEIDYYSAVYIDGGLNELEVNKSVHYMQASFSPSVLTRLIRALPDLKSLVIRKREGQMHPPNNATMKSFFTELLNLKDLRNLACYNELLLDEAVIECIHNRPKRSRLNFLKFNQRGDWKLIVDAYKKQFPFRLNCNTDLITLFRY